MPADQIEQRLNEIVARAQQPLPDYAPRPEPGGMPAPGFGEGSGDRWRSSEEFIKNLIGQGGPRAPGVLESWKDLNDSLSQTLTNPLGAVKDEIEHALNSPSVAYYAGEKAFDIGASAATLPFGAEGAAVRAGLPAEIATPGGAPTALLRGWDPVGNMPWDEFASRFGTPEARIWPDNNGFPPGYQPQLVELPAGTIIDRFGSEGGRYLAPDGSPFVDRALTPESSGATYNRYIVTGEPMPEGW
ncbi:MAG: TNT domain-containing protein [Mycobacterium sp.]